MTPEQEEYMKSRCPVYQPLFEHMEQEHGVTLLESEAVEILEICRPCIANPDTAKLAAAEARVRELEAMLWSAEELAKHRGDPLQKCIELEAKLTSLRAAVDGVMPYLDEDYEGGIMTDGYKTAIERLRKEMGE